MIEDRKLFCCKPVIVSKKGFSLIEFLLVIGVIGVLASIIFISVSGGAGKANRAAFVDEVVASIPGILTLCVNGNINIGSIADTENVNWTAVDSQNCGSGSGVTFCVRARNKTDFVETDDGNCLVSVDDKGKIYDGGTCTTVFTSNHCK